MFTVNKIHKTETFLLRESKLNLFFKDVKCGFFRSGFLWHKLNTFIIFKDLIASFVQFVIA